MTLPLKLSSTINPDGSETVEFHCGVEECCQGRENVMVVQFRGDRYARFVKAGGGCPLNFEVDPNEPKCHAFGCSACVDYKVGFCFQQYYGAARWDEDGPRIVVERKPISVRLRTQVLERDDWTCQRCGDERRLVIDHVWPVSLGGETEAPNLQVLCELCNARKSNHYPELWEMENAKR